MPITDECYGPIKGIALRVIQTDSCGVPVTGNSMVVAAGFVRATADPQYDTGDRKILRTADDVLCVNDKVADALLAFNLSVELCTIDPGLVALTISPARLLTFSASPTGSGFALQEGTATTHFSLEIWQRISGRNACLTGTTKYVYNAWPHVMDGKIGGGYVIGADPSQLIIAGDTKAVSPSWTAGNPWLGTGAISVNNADHWFQNVTTVAPPTPTCGIQNYTAPS